MKIATNLFNHLLETKGNQILGVVIENGRLFREFVCALYECVENGDDSILFSENNEEIDVSEKVELISQFVPFSLNSKSLIAALNKKVEKIAMRAENRDKLEKLIAVTSKYISELLLEIPHEIDGIDISIGGLIKLAGLRFAEEGASLSNLLVDYMRLVREFMGDKFFIFINLRSYLTDKEMREMIKVCRLDNFRMMLIDSCSRGMLNGETRFLVDEDLCELVSTDDDML